MRERGRGRGEVRERGGQTRAAGGRLIADADPSAQERSLPCSSSSDSLL